MSTKIEYYFKKLDKFPIPGFFDGLSETFEILSRAKEYLNETLVKNNVQENHAELRGDEIGRAHV